jgi:hypothetical protein
MQLESFNGTQREAIVRLSLHAWARVFASMKLAMLPAVYEAFWGDDWCAAQQRAVEAVCSDPNVNVFVATVDGQTAGFVALRLRASDRMGEIYMIAVDPDFHRRDPDLVVRPDERRPRAPNGLERLLQRTFAG